MNEKPRKKAPYLKEETHLDRPQSPLGPLVWFLLLLIPVVLVLLSSAFQSLQSTDLAPQEQQAPSKPKTQKAPDTRRSSINDLETRRGGR